MFIDNSGAQVEFDTRSANHNSTQNPMLVLKFCRGVMRGQAETKLHPLCQALKNLCSTVDTRVLFRYYPYIVAQ